MSGMLTSPPRAVSCCQGFQFLLLNKQLLTISLSQRLQGKNPLKTLQATHKNKQGTVGIF